MDSGPGAAQRDYYYYYLLLLFKLLLLLLLLLLLYYHDHYYYYYYFSFISVELLGGRKNRGTVKGTRPVCVRARTCACGGEAFPCLRTISAGMRGRDGEMVCNRCKPGREGPAGYIY